MKTVECFFLSYRVSCLLYLADISSTLLIHIQNHGEQIVCFLELICIKTTGRYSGYVGHRCPFENKDISIENFRDVSDSKLKLLLL